MTIAELMTKDVISVTPESEIGEVAKLLTHHRIHGMPVVENGKVVGIVVEDDFFTNGSVSLHLPSYIDFLKKAKAEKTVEGAQKDEISKLYGVKVKDIMTPDCLTLPPEADAREVLARFNAGGHKTFPVVDAEKNLVGIITLADILRLF